MRMPPLPADSIHARACKLKCEKILTRPAYMREHPEVTSKSAIAKAVGTDRNTVRKYYDEIRSELGLK